MIVQVRFLFTNCSLPPTKLWYYSLWRRKVKFRVFVSFVSGREIFKNCFRLWSYTSECSLRVQRIAFIRCDVKKLLFIVFLWLVVNLRFFSFVSGRKISRTIFVSCRTCKSSPYELLPAQRVLFLLALTSKSKVETFLFLCFS